MRARVKRLRVRNCLDCVANVLEVALTSRVLLEVIEHARLEHAQPMPESAHRLRDPFAPQAGQDCHQRVEAAQLVGFLQLGSVWDVHGRQD